MTSEELKQWQVRLGLSQIEAAKQTNTPVSTYRHYLIGIRRIPDNFKLLCRYRERFGNICQEEEKREHGSSTGK